MLRSNVWNSNIEICEDEHSFNLNSKEQSLTELLKTELKQLSKEGNKIDHPPTGSKDIADVLAILNHDLTNLEITETENESEDDKFKKLCEIYMNEKYELIKQSIAEKEQDLLLMLKLSLTEKEYKKLKVHVKEVYNY